MLKKMIMSFAFLFFALGGGSMHASAKEMNFERVLQAAFEKNPNLQSSAIQVKIKTTDRHQVEGMLDTSYGASVGLSNQIAPTTNPFAPTETSSSFLNAQIIKPFSNGSSITAKMQYDRLELGYPSTVIPAFQSNPNPTYEHQIDLIYRYPLKSGHDNPNYRYQKSASEQDIKAARYQVAITKEQLANQGIVLCAQFELNNLSLKLAKDAALRAQQLLNYQQQQASFGLVEEEDLLPTKALLAARKLQLTQAVAARKTAKIALNRFMFQDGDTPLSLKLSPLKQDLKTVSNMLGTAEQKRPIFDVLDAQSAAAESRLSMAEASGDYQLDLVGQVGTRALDGTAGGAFQQGFSMKDRYIGLRLDFADVWDNKTSRSAIQKSLLALESIKIERRKAVEDLKTELSSLRASIQSGRLTVRAAKVQVTAENKKFKAEMQRFKKGRSSTSVITQYEGDLRAAELRYLIQKVNLNVVEYQLALALGELPALAKGLVGVTR